MQEPDGPKDIARKHSKEPLEETSRNSRYKEKILESDSGAQPSISDSLGERTITDMGCIYTKPRENHRNQKQQSGQQNLDDFAS